RPSPGTLRPTPSPARSCPCRRPARRRSRTPPTPPPRLLPRALPASPRRYPPSSPSLLCAGLPSGREPPDSTPDETRQVVGVRVKDGHHEQCEHGADGEPTDDHGGERSIGVDTR